MPKTLRKINKINLISSHYYCSFNIKKQANCENLKHLKQANCEKLILENSLKLSTVKTTMIK